MEKRLPRLLEEGRVEVRLGINGTHVFEESGIDRLLSHLTEAKLLLNPDDAERGLVCMFCGKGFGYHGQTPGEATLRAAVDHEKECPRNPYKAEVERLMAALEKEKRLHSQTEGMRLDHLKLGNARYAEIERLTAFVVDARDNWECDTTGHEKFETHRPAQCRRCQAGKLVPRAEAVRP